MNKICSIMEGEEKGNEKEKGEKLVLTGTYIHILLLSSIIITKEVSY